MSLFARRLLPQTASGTTAAAASSSLPPERLTKPIFSTGLGITIRPKNWQPSTMRRGDDDDTLVTNAAKKKAFYTIVKADLLIPGDGDLLEDAALVIEGKLIAWVGAAADLPGKYIDAAPQHHRVFSVPVVMPGLWDVHTHFDGGGPDDMANYLSFLTEHPASQGARLARQCWESLQRGYETLPATVVRSPKLSMTAVSLAQTYTVVGAV
ncbi:amidohydrolase [Apiospora arundinis]